MILNKMSAMGAGMLMVGLLACAANGHAEENQQSPGRNSAVDAAIKECMALAAADANGRPDRAAVDSCMTAKGFTKPQGGPGGPGGRGRGGPPPRPPQDSDSSDSESAGSAK